MMVMFTHRCPHCGRNRRLPIAELGQTVKCVQCQQTSVATDPHNESLAMFDSIKEHAELTNVPADRAPDHRVPR